MADAPVGAVSTEYPSSTKFCRRESAIVGSSSTTRIRTSLFSTFFSSLEIAAPWGMIDSPFDDCRFPIAKCRLAISGRMWCAGLLINRQLAIGNWQFAKAEAQPQTSYLRNLPTHRGPRLSLLPAPVSLRRCRRMNETDPDPVGASPTIQQQRGNHLL